MKKLRIVVIGAVIVLGLWLYFRPVLPSCALNQGNCAPFIGLEKGATLWLTPGQPKPGDVYRVVRDGNVATASLISDYLDSRAPLTERGPSMDRSVSVNDSGGIQASARFLKGLASQSGIDFSHARSVSLEARDTEYLAIKSRSAFLTWLQDDVDPKKRDTSDGENLIGELRNPLPASTEDDRADGERYLVTEILRARTMKFASSDQQHGTAGIDCGGKDKDCKIINFGRSSDSASGDTINKASKPIVFWVKMYRIGAAKNGTLRYDEHRPGPLMIGQ